MGIAARDFVARTPTGFATWELCIMFLR